MRYLPLTPTDRGAMLSRIGVDAVDDLFVDVPETARLEGPINLPAHQSEMCGRELSRRSGSREA